MPKPLRGIEVRRIGRQREHLNVAAVLGKELQDLGFLVKRGVVLNEIYSMAAAIIMWQQFFVHEGYIGFGVEVFGLVPPDKSAGGNPHRPQNLWGGPFATRRNFRLLTAARPSAIECRRLAKGGFVFINNQRALVLWFALVWPLTRVYEYLTIGDIRAQTGELGV